jgi:hypothetical protein
MAVMARTCKSLLIAATDPVRAAQLPGACTICLQIVADSAARWHAGRPSAYLQ